jgi:glycosyltransferase involved in cell wall biosynthesis
VRILTLTTSYPLHAGDMSGVFVARMAHELTRLGHEVRVLTPDDHRPPDARGARSEVHVRPVPYARPRALQRLCHGHGMPENLSRTPALALLAPGLVRRLHAATWRASAEADLLLTHWLLPAGVIAAGIAAARGLPHVAIAHSGDVSLPARFLPAPLRLRFHEHLTRGTARVAFTHRALAARYRERFGAPPSPVITPMGVEPPRAPAARSAWSTESPLKVLCVARLTRVKGVDLLLDATRTRPEVELTIAGDGPLAPRLRAQAAPLGERARFLGHVSPEALPELYARHHLLAVPSRVLPTGRSEGVPHALLDAMAHGLPVVASRVGGIPDVVTEGVNGWLVAPERADAIGHGLDAARAAGGALADMGRGAADMTSDYAWSRVVARIGEGFW